ncbi:Proline-responsive transcriptional activator PutR [bioreactor metagenome]|uniref:Proline-responsive transcriptional activator PutR n=1 Tax=bioreactor metagenome TaxID=1076179 RepID=A0A645HQD3_9ZZZZ
MEMAKKRGESCCYYENLGLYKVLYAVDDKAILREYYGDVLGKLKAYDRENKTELTQLLKAYLENNGSLQLVSEKKYVHRNTVTNQLKRIEKITGLNPLDLEDKLKFYLGFCVGEIL